MKIIQNTLKLERNIRCLNSFRVEPKKVESVGFPEQDIFGLTNVKQIQHRGKPI